MATSLKTLLTSLTQSAGAQSDRAYAVAVRACGVLDAGLSSIIPSPCERADVVSGLLAGNKAAPFGARTPKYALRCLLLDRCASEPLLASLFPPWTATSPAALDDCHAALRSLMDSALKDDLNSVRTGAGAPPASPRLAGAISRVVAVYARHVCVGVANAIDARERVASAPAPPLLYRTLKGCS